VGVGEEVAVASGEWRVASGEWEEQRDSSLRGLRSVGGGSFFGEPKMPA
jgi:hypothetical protein